MQSFRKYLLLGSLYLSQFMPVWFLQQGLPVLMRQDGLSLEVIGLLPLLMLPIAFKFLWAPLIDLYSIRRWGHYRFWIILFQFWVMGLTVFCSFQNLEQQLPILLAGLALIAIGSSSQDIATDALALKLLTPAERGTGNAVQVIGGALGRTIGGGGMLILLSRWGWQASLLTLATLMLLGLIPLLFHQEVNASRSHPTRSAPPSKNGGAIAYLKILATAWQRPGVKLWLMVLALAAAGYSVSETMFRPLLVDIGLSLEEIGWLLGVVGMMMTIWGSLVAGVMIPKFGRQRSLLVSMGLSLFGMFLKLLPTWGLTQPMVLYPIISLGFFAMGLLLTTLSTIMMDKSRPDMAGTDYTLQTSVIPFVSIFSAAPSGWLASSIGYQGVFLIGMGISIVAIGLAFKVLRLTEINSSPHKVIDGI
ncbi:MAG: MFS transporter [Cyanobacteria bacterium P01_G01_bin.54]